MAGSPAASTACNTHGPRDDDILISDVGTNKLWVGKFYPVYSNNALLISNGFASMGFGLPAAIAAKLIYPEKKVLAVCGDGGFLMNVHEIRPPTEWDSTS